MPDQVSFASAARPILVVGSVAYDNIITQYEKGDRILGGSASYAGLAASYFSPVRLVGVVGHDFHEQDVNRLRARGIDLEGLETDASGPTFFWSGKYHEDFNNRETLDLQLNVFASFEPKLPDSYKSTPYLLLGNIHPNLQSHVLDCMEDSPFVMADTIDFWIQSEHQAFSELIKRVDCLVINDDEAGLFTGESNMINAGRKLIEMGPRMAIVKKGSHGAYLFHPEGLFALPAYPVTELRDPTGAGDSFAGALLGYLAAKDDISYKSIKQGMLFATATASLTVEAFSCNRLETAGPAAIEQRADELLKMMSL